MEGSVQLGTEDTVGGGPEVYDARSQEVDKRAIEAINSMPEALRKTIVAHKHKAEPLVKVILKVIWMMRLAPVTVEPDYPMTKHPSGMR